MPSIHNLPPTTIMKPMNDFRKPQPMPGIHNLPPTTIMKPINDFREGGVGNYKNEIYKYIKIHTKYL